MVILKNPKRVKQGKRNKINGAIFEKKVRLDLESRAWIVDKWSNNVELVYSVNEERKDTRVEGGKLIPARSKWAGPGRPMMLGQGMPDFIAFKRRSLYFRVLDENILPRQLQKIKNNIDKMKTFSPNKPIVTSSNIEITPETEVIGVESKVNGQLDKQEREKCQWYLDNGIFSKILIAYKVKEGRKVVVKYKEFKNGK